MNLLRLRFRWNSSRSGSAMEAFHPAYQISSRAVNIEVRLCVCVCVCVCVRVCVCVCVLHSLGAVAELLHMQKSRFKVVAVAKNLQYDFWGPSKFGGPRLQPFSLIG